MLAFKQKVIKFLNLSSDDVLNSNLEVPKAIEKVKLNVFSTISVFLDLPCKSMVIRAFKAKTSMATLVIVPDVGHVDMSRRGCPRC